MTGNTVNVLMILCAGNIEIGLENFECVCSVLGGFGVGTLSICSVPARYTTPCPQCKQMEDQMSVDRCMLGELKWKQAKLKKLENKMRADQKRTK